MKFPHQTNVGSSVASNTHQQNFMNMMVMKKSERSIASRKVKTAHLKEVLCFIFCRVYLLFTFVTFSIAPNPALWHCFSYLAPNLHAKDKYFEPSAIEYG